jgi:hypothetical protein
MESYGSGAAFFLVKKRARFVTAMPVGERNDLNKRLSLRQNYSHRNTRANLSRNKFRSELLLNYPRPTRKYSRRNSWEIHGRRRVFSIPGKARPKVTEKNERDIKKTKTRRTRRMLPKHDADSV